MNLKLNDKVVILTGGTGGIGSAIALDFLLEGSKLILFYRNEEKKDKLLGELANQVDVEQLVDPIKINILDKKEINETVSEIRKKYGRIDVLINCAGFAHERPFMLLTDDEMDDMIDLNFKSPLWLTRAVLRPMIKQKAGNIINISSLSTHAYGRGITVYAAAKAALERFTQTLAQEVGKKNIRVNVVCPGVIHTEMSNNIRSILGDVILLSTSLKKYGLPHEVSKACLYLASDEMSSFVNGQVLKVDGGFNL